MEDQQQTNKVTVDAAEVSQQNSGESKKTKKKRNYWKRRNSKASTQNNDDETESIEETTPETFPDNPDFVDERGDEQTQNETGIYYDTLQLEVEKGDTVDTIQTFEEKEKVVDILEYKENYTTSDFTASGDFIEETICSRTITKSLLSENVAKSTRLEVSNEVQDHIGEAVVDGKMSSAPSVLVPPDQNMQDKKSFEEIEDEQQSSEATYNTRFLLKETKTYEVETFSKNAMIIFNHFDIKGYNKRYGTEKDVEALKATFAKLGFKDDIFVHDDLDYRGIDKSLEEFSSCDFTQYGCVFVVVLTHGSTGGYIRAKDRSYHESELISHFFDKRNQSLVTKPKVFVIQACRGTKASEALTVGLAMRVQRDAAKEPARVYTLPTESDVLLLHSSYAGTAAHREIQNGSWFIQTFCRFVDRLADSTDLEAIMTEVKNDVAINKLHVVYNKGTSRTDINKQIPVVMSTLIRKLYLKKPPANPSENDGPGGNISIIDGVSEGPSFDLRLLDYGRVVLPKQHFLHMRHVLKVFHDREPNPTSKILLSIANSIDENVVPDVTMDKTAKGISEYLKTYAVNWNLYDMIMFL